MSVPGWVIEATVAMTKAIVSLLKAETDGDREKALLEAAEASKAALDALKFPNG